VKSSGYSSSPRFRQQEQKESVQPFLRRAASIRIIVDLMLMTLLLAASCPSPVIADSRRTLGVYGNASGDDVIDMRDVTCIERLISGLSANKRLADATFDGRVDLLDVNQVQQIIVGREKALTLLDEREKAITINKPVRRVIPEHITSLAAMRVLHAQDRIVSIGSSAVKESMGRVFLQSLADLPTIGTYAQPDYEAILSLNPDLLIAYRRTTLKEKLAGVQVFYAGYGEPYPPDHLAADIRILGHLLGEQERANAYIDWHNAYLDMIKGRVARLSEDEKPAVYVFYPLTGLYKCRGDYPPVHIAGGISIGKDLGPGFAIDVDPEWVIQQNPDVIIATTIPENGAYETDDPSTVAAARKAILSRPELQKVTAVKTGNVYFINTYAMGLFPNFILSIVYYAKWFHPDLFRDLDPIAVHQEYLDRFQDIDFQVEGHGVFVYP
jgi:iron complex transport system substrate-binding protein